MTFFLAFTENINLYLRLIWEFFQTGLFAVGGGMATVPFLQRIGERTGWYSYEELMNMLAISESTPGPLGVNMATFAGFLSAGLPGAVITTVSEIAPSIIVILIVASMLERFRDNPKVNSCFYGLRPASTALVFSALGTLAISVSKTIQFTGIILLVVLFIATNYIPKIKKLHPIAFIAFAGIAGIVLKL